MRKFVFLLTMSMMLFAGMASVSEARAENIPYIGDVGSVDVATLDAQVSVNDVAFEPVQINIAPLPVEYNVMDAYQYTAVFSDVGLKPYNILIPSKRITTLNYFAGIYNTKYRYRCGCLQRDVLI